MRNKMLIIAFAIALCVMIVLINNSTKEKGDKSTIKMTEEVKNLKQLRELKETDLPERMQMGIQQVRVILQAIINTSESTHDSSIPSTNILVWGCGNDSPFWRSLTSGKIVFIEDNPIWFKKIAEAFPFLSIVKVNYTTTMNEETFKKYTKSNHYWSDLDIRYQLPDWVLSTKWDVILVDAPAGFRSNTPGRYQSIYTTYCLLKPPCHIFIDDCERTCEDIFGKMVFGEDHYIGYETRDKTPNKQCYYFYNL